MAQKKKPNIIEDQNVKTMNIKSIVANINKSIKEDVAIVGSRNKKQKYVSSGNSLLDLIISNRKHAGIPIGRVTFLTGLSGSGKSLIAAHALANIQKSGGIAILIDTEAAAVQNYLRVIGVDLDALIRINCDTLQYVYNVIQKLCIEISTQYPDLDCLIVVDSLTSTTIKDQQQKDHELSGYNMKKARVNSESLKRIVNIVDRYNIGLLVTAQVRQNPNAGLFGQKYIMSSGGEALRFYSSIGIMIKPVGKIKGKINGIERIIGTNVRAKIQKGRLGPTGMSVDFQIYFDSGIDDYNSWLEFLKKFKLIEGKGTKSSPYELTNEAGQTVTFSKYWAQQLDEDPVKREFVYDFIADKLIMKYKKSDVLAQRDVEIVTGDVQINLTGDDEQSEEKEQLDKIKQKVKLLTQSQQDDSQ